MENTKISRQDELMEKLIDALAQNTAEMQKHRKALDENTAKIQGHHAAMQNFDEHLSSICDALGEPAINIRAEVENCRKNHGYPKQRTQKDAIKRDRLVSELNNILNEYNHVKGRQCALEHLIETDKKTIKRIHENLAGVHEEDYIAYCENGIKSTKTRMSKIYRRIEERKREAAELDGKIVKYRAEIERL